MADMVSKSSINVAVGSKNPVKLNSSIKVHYFHSYNFLRGFWLLLLSIHPIDKYQGISLALKDKFDVIGHGFDVASGGNPLASVFITSLHYLLDYTLDKFQV